MYTVPLILKGVQRWEVCCLARIVPVYVLTTHKTQDALQAYDLGLAGVVLSNHGGRQLDFARSGIEVLHEVVTELSRRRNLTFPNDKFALFIDGGVRRATDVLKAVALGATAVGIGRPFLYAFSSYGQQGVEHALQILKDEFEMNMRLLGAPTLADVTRDLVDADNIRAHTVAVPGDRLYEGNCEYLKINSLRNVELITGLDESMQVVRLRDMKAKL